MQSARWVGAGRKALPDRQAESRTSQLTPGGHVAVVAGSARVNSRRLDGTTLGGQGYKVGNQSSMGEPSVFQHRRSGSCARASGRRAQVQQRVACVLEPTYDRRRNSTVQELGPGHPVDRHKSSEMLTVRTQLSGSQ